MEKIRVAFLAPKNKGGTYYYYEAIVEYLRKEYSTQFEVYFFNSFSSYIKLHFLKFDLVFSIIPFLFKPLFVKKYIYNLHGNYKIERKNKGLGVKLLYLSELNFWFSDNILLTSNYLADKLNFKKKYENKIIISPLFVDKIYENENKINLDCINLLTISSSNFLLKGLGVYDLAKQIFDIKNININWKVILPGDKKNKSIILDKISSLNVSSNINFEIFDFIEKKDLFTLYKESDIFVYSSNLETWGGVIMDACSYGKPIILLENDLWKYIYPNEFITSNFESKFFEILKNYDYFSKLSYSFSGNFLKEKIINEFIKIIKE